MGEGIFCVTQLKLVTSSHASEQGILPNAGLEHTLPDNTITYENCTKAKTCKALIFILLVVCAAHLQHNITFYWRWNASI